MPKPKVKPTLPGISASLQTVMDELGTLNATLEPGIRQILVEHAHANLVVAANAIARADPQDEQHPGYIITVDPEQLEGDSDWYAFAIRDDLAYLKNLSTYTGVAMRYPRDEYPILVQTKRLKPETGSRGGPVPCSIRQRT